MILTLIPLASPLGWDYTFLMSLLACMEDQMRARVLNELTRAAISE